MAAAKKPKAASKGQAKPKPATKATADKAKRSARQKPGPKKKPGTRKPGQQKKKGPKLTAAEQSMRDSLMVAREIQGWPLQAIAAEAGLTVAGARRAISQKKKAPEKMLNDDPVEIIEQLATAFAGDIADLQAMALAYADWHPSAAVGAKKAAAAVRTNLQELYQSVGVLPHELGQLRVLIDLRAVIVQIVESVDDFVGEVNQIAEGDKKIPAKRVKEIRAAAAKVTETLDQIGGVEEEDKVPA